MSAALVRRRAPIPRLALVTGLALCLPVLAATVALAVGSGAGAAEPVTPTVTFVREGGQGSCTSVPTVSSLMVPLGTDVIVANETGRPANLYVGGASVLRVTEGGGAALTLAAGQHDVRLAPSCLKYADAPSLTVTVMVSGPPTGGSSTGGSSTGGSSGGGSSGGSSTGDSSGGDSSGGDSSEGGSSEGGSSGGGSSGGGSSTGGAVTTPSTAPGPATSSRPVPPGSSRTRATGTSSTGAESAVVPASAGGTPSHGEVMAVSTATPLGVISARPLALPNPDHSKGLRLLATIATICVLGVTAAIIRAIVRLSP